MLACGLENLKKGKGDSPDPAVMGQVKDACESYLAAFDDFDASRAASDTLVAAIEASMDSLTNSAKKVCEGVLKFKDQLAKKTFWMFGGDGWAYDIGFGGTDHVVASGANVNVLVVDTEVYSNTGGQKLEGHARGRSRSVRGERQEDGQEGFGRNPYELR